MNQYGGSVTSYAANILPISGTLRATFSIGVPDSSIPLFRSLYDSRKAESISLDYFAVSKRIAHICKKTFGCTGRGGLLIYLLWGWLSMLFSIACFKLLLLCGLVYWEANLLALILLKIFVFITNKIFVFKTEFINFTELAKEAFRFLSARMFTNVTDYFGLILLVEFFKQDAFYSKVCLAVIVVILNYIFSKLFVFRSIKLQSSGQSVNCHGRNGYKTGSDHSLAQKMLGDIHARHMLRETSHL